MASLSSEVLRDGERVFSGFLEPRLSSDAGFHYYAVPEPAVEESDEVVVSFDAPPQVARHMGYETAFVEMPDVSVSV